MRKVRYVSVKRMDNTKRITEYVDAELFDIRYRHYNAKTNRSKIVKFDRRKKLEVEVVFSVSTAGGRRIKVVSQSYGLKAAKRKNPVSRKIILNQIQKKHLLKIKRGHLIVNRSEPQHNLYAWTYFYQAKTRAELKAQRKKRKKAQLLQQKKVQQKKAQRIKKGSHRENRTSPKAQMQLDRTVSGKLSRAQSSRDRHGNRSG